MSGAIELHVNGSKHTIDAPPEERLLNVLRDNLGLTGSKYGCGEGRCGACTVVIDGQAVRSCITLVERCAGKQITTIEGLAEGDKLHPLQEAFLAADAMQCGYCTAGMIMGGYALLKSKSSPTHEEIVAGMDGHICRCCTYSRIVAAIEQAAGTQQGGA